MKRIIAENVLANVRLEATTCKDSVTRFRVLSRDVVMFRGVNIDKAFRMYDLHVDKALHTQPEKVMSGIDLENPPAVLLTTSGRKVRLVGNTDEGDCPYVISVEDGKYPILLYSNRNGSVTVSTSRLEVTVFTLCTVKANKTGWINIYSSDRCSSNVYPTEKVAIGSANNAASLVKTVEITWEE